MDSQSNKKDEREGKRRGKKKIEEKMAVSKLTWFFFWIDDT